MTVLQIQRVNSLPDIKEASTLYIVKASDSDKVDLYFTGEVASELRHIITKAEIQALMIDGDGVIAEALKTARTINGVPFDGTEDIVINAVDSTARIAESEKGAINGVAPLDANQKVASAYLPSYVDDVLEFNGSASFPATGESGKIYIDTAVSTNNTYRWSGSGYVVISASPGSTDSITEGAVNKYFTTEKVLNTLLAGVSLITAGVINSRDTILVALGKLQKQLTDHFSAVNPHSVTAAQVGTIKVSKVTAVPTEFTADTMYIVKLPGDSSSRIYVSDSTGSSISPVGSDEELDSFLLMGMS